ncbi:MAG: hypothetical protein OXN25_01755 [Candidatus Poribacteria bacterium]|nr:hypothetical protein [Candidatus Poribacteria bacterium]
MIDEGKERLDEFKKELRRLSATRIVRKHILFGECCMLSQDKYFDLRSEVADHFGLHPNDVLVVGSTKLGFSVVPDKKYRLFGNESDIDVALVSSRLFDEFWEQVFRYKYEGSYWPEYDQFVDYFFRGWIRPDKLPRSSMFPLREDWWNFFRSITNSRKYGDFKISGGLYKSYFFLENYQTICIQQCIDNLEEKNANNSDK